MKCFSKAIYHLSVEICHRSLPGNLPMFIQFIYQAFIGRPLKAASAMTNDK
jgi:hypothetical protein